MAKKSTQHKVISIANWFLFVGLGLNLVFGSDFHTLDFQFRIVAIITMLLTATYVSWLFFNQRTGFLLLQFWIFNSIFFVLVPIAVISNKSSWFVNYALDQDSKISTFYGVIGLLLISVVGSELRLRSLGLNKTRYELDVSRFRIISLSYFCLLVYLVVFEKKFVSNSLKGYGSSQMVSSVSSLENGLSKAYFVALPMLFVLFLLRTPYKVSHFSRRFVLLLCLSILVVFANPVGNSRQTFLLAFLPIFVAVFNKSFILFRFLALAIVIVTIFGQPFTYAISHSAENIGKFGISGMFESYVFDPNQILVKGDFDSFSMFAIGIRYLGLEGLAFPFSQFFGVLLFFVPRNIWAGKPRDTAIEVANLAGFEFQNLSAPWLLELLANGGIVLLCFGAYLVPRALKRIDRMSNVDDFRWLMWSLLIGSEFILLRGSLLQAAGVVIFGAVMSRLLVKKVW